MEPWEDVMVPSKGMKLSSGEGMVVEKSVNIVVDWLLPLWEITFCRQVICYLIWIFVID